MVGTGAIITERLSGVAAHENRTGMANQRQQFFRLCNRQFQMLGCNEIDHLGRLGQVAHLNQCRSSLQGRGDDLAPFHLRQQAFDGLCHPL